MVYPWRLNIISLRIYEAGHFLIPGLEEVSLSTRVWVSMDGSKLSALRSSN
jgi:hypothetical protein